MSEKKIKEELIKRVQPFLPAIRPSAVAARPTLENIKSGNNLRHIDDMTLINMFDLEHDSINFRLEGAMDQLDMILDEMTDLAEVELMHDYPEIAKVMEVLYDYRRSPKTADGVKTLYNLTRYLNLPSRTFEMKTPSEIERALRADPATPEFQPKLEQSFEVFLNLEESLNKKLIEEQKMQEKLEYEKKLNYELEQEKILEQEKELENKKENNNAKHHPYYIPNKLKLTPFN